MLLVSFCFASDVYISWIDNPNALVHPPEQEGDRVKNAGSLEDYPDFNFSAIVVNIPLDSTYKNINTEILYVIKGKGIIVREGAQFQSYGWDELDDRFLFHPVYMMADYKTNKFENKIFRSMDDCILTSEDAYSLDRFGMLMSTQFDFVLDLCEGCVEKEKNDCLLRSNMALLHAFYSPYFYPSQTKWSYAELLKDKVEKKFLSIGKNELDIRLFYKKLSQNRKPISLTSVDADFVSLGRIGGMNEVKKNGESFCEIMIYPTVIFRDSLSKYQNTYVENNYDASFFSKEAPRIINAQKKGMCFPTTSMFQQNYLFGSYQKKSLFLDSILSPWDFFYDNGKLVDLRMGLSYDDFLSYFIPKELTLDDAYYRASTMGSFVSEEYFTSDQIEQINAGSKKMIEYCEEQKSKNKNKQ